MKITIDLDKPFLDLDSSPVDDSSMCKILSNSLSNATEGDSLKFWDWSLTLHSKKPLEIDKSDFDKLKNFLTNTKLPAIMKGQLLLELDKAKENSEKKPVEPLKKAK